MHPVFNELISGHPYGLLVCFWYAELQTKTPFVLSSTSVAWISLGVSFGPRVFRGWITFDDEVPIPNLRQRLFWHPKVSFAAVTLARSALCVTRQIRSLALAPCLALQERNEQEGKVAAIKSLQQWRLTDVELHNFINR